MKDNIKINELCYSTLSHDNPNSYETYVSLGGYTTWKNILSDSIEKRDIIETVIKSGLRGRGGAGFSTGRKWSFINQDSIYYIDRKFFRESDVGIYGSEVRYQGRSFLGGMFEALSSLGRIKNTKQKQERTINIIATS